MGIIAERVTLLAVGDMMFGDLGVTFGFGVASTIQEHGPLFPLARCLNELRTGDIRFGNLETVLSKFDMVHDPYEQIQLRGQPEAAQALAAAQFDVVSLANNHIMQHGREAVAETINLLRENGIGFTGIEFPEKSIESFHQLTVKGSSFGFLGYNFRPVQYRAESRCDVAGSLERIRLDVERHRNDVDHVVVSVHWGDEFIDYPSPEQVKVGREIIDCGAALVLGHHPHILQGVEKYHHGVIAYSLGNFVFDMWQPRLRRSMILKCIFSGSGDVTFATIPVEINSSFQPEILYGPEGRRLQDHIRSLSRKISDEASIRSAYDRELKKNTRRFRREVLWRYFTWLHRYNKRRLVDNVKRVVMNRISS
jgi:gamma-polyglutamate biosynthesis protein CapA